VFLERSIVDVRQLLAPDRAPAQPVRFIGTTLWSDFDALQNSDPMTPSPDPDLLQRHKAMRAANFYLNKAATTRNGQSMLAEQLREQALICQAWLRQALAEPFEGQTVVVTHFAPSLLSGDPRYGVTPGTAGFCNSLDTLLTQVQVWLHGHLHCPSDYVKNGCRVVANPLGYARKGEQALFNPELCLQI
jgi:hypothetical protein